MTNNIKYSEYRNFKLYITYQLTLIIKLKALHRQFIKIKFVLQLYVKTLLMDLLNMEMF